MIGSYTIEKIIFVKRFQTHIPFYLGMLVKGPKGGYYYIDEFCTEIALRKHFNNLIMSDRTSVIMSNIGREMKNIQLIKEAEDIDAALKLYKVTKLIRLKGVEKAEIIGKNITIPNV